MITETHLTKEEIEIVEQLLKCIKKNEFTVSYKELSERLSFKPNPHFGFRTPLYRIGNLCRELGLPFITFIVVNQDLKLPGEGFRVFFEDMGINIDNKSTEELFSEEREKINRCPNWQLLADNLGIDIKMPVSGEIIYPEEINKNSREIFEGARKNISVNSYERDPFARKDCINFYAEKDGKIKCQICGFDFEEFYGEEYRNLIHVHHIVPLSSIRRTYKVNPQKDLIPVCPNCHMVLHSKVGETVEQLKERLKEKIGN